MPELTLVNLLLLLLVVGATLWLTKKSRRKRARDALLSEPVSRREHQDLDLRIEQRLQRLEAGLHPGLLGRLAGLWNARAQPLMVAALRDDLEELRTQLRRPRTLDEAEEEIAALQADLTRERDRADDLDGEVGRLRDVSVAAMRSDAEMDRARSELSQARLKQDDLQLQLDSANRQLADARAKLRRKDGTLTAGQDNGTVVVPQLGDLVPGLEVALQKLQAAENGKRKKPHITEARKQVEHLLASIKHNEARAPFTVLVISGKQGGFDKPTEALRFAKQAADDSRLVRATCAIVDHESRLLAWVNNRTPGR